MAPVTGGRPAAAAAADRAAAPAALAAGLLAGHAAVNARLLRRPPAARPVAEPVSLLLPVRDEEHRLAACLASLLSQQGLADSEILVYDDASSDGSAALARRIGGSRVQLLAGDGPPAGWLGKPHACARLAAAARGRVLVFVDADVVCAPDAVARTVLLLRRHGLGWVSPYPRQQAAGLLPRLVQPLLQWSWLTFLPLRLAESAARPGLAVANGQLLAVDVEAYRRSGGHAAVRNAVLDDLCLARRLRAAGYRGGLADGTSLATCRMYTSNRELADGYGKSLWAAFGGPGGAAAAAALLAALYLLPLAAALRGSRWGLAGVATGVAGRVVAARRTGGSVGDAAGHPASVLVLLGLLARSLRRHRTGRLSWKGRAIR